jgi:TolA-binding protein
MSSASDPNDSPALSTLTELVRGAVRRPTEAELERSFDELRARMATGKQRGRATSHRLLVAAAFLVCLGLCAGGALFWLRASGVSQPRVALSRIEGGRVLEGGYLSESGKAGIKLFFDEGSAFVLTPGSRGRLRWVDATDTRLALEHGTASLRITPSQEHHWSVEAGPFLVEVKGTDFTVFWDPTSESFELRLRRGRVTVNGPVVGQALVIRPGQKLSVSLPRAETVITEESLAEAAENPASSLPNTQREAALLPEPLASANLAARSPEPAPAPPTPSAGTNERRWPSALASGQWDKIIADAERHGVDATLRTASSDDLLALADAARYRRRGELARAALLAQRNRFPSSQRSVDAAFLLGRVEESQGSGKAAALRWYDEYLARAPSGTYAAEALGRKMILTKEIGGPGSARPLANEYLQRFPAGSYAGAARALQRAP